MIIEWDCGAALIGPILISLALIAGRILQGN
jgi:hypothetical protein